MRRILDAHPRIHCGPEVTFFRDFFEEYDGDPLAHLRFARTIRSIVDEDDALRALGAAYLRLHEVAAARAGKVRWADKSPDNAVHLEHWSSLLGDRWFYVHVVRSPLDTLASIADAGFPRSIPASLEGRIAHYNRYASLGLDFVEQHPDRSQVVLYERLVDAPAPTIHDLMGGLAEASHPSQVTFNEVAHQPGLEDPKVTRSDTIHGESVGRWSTELDPATADRIRSATARTWARAQALAG